MSESTQNLTENEVENQVLDPKAVKLRFLEMQLSGDYPMLEQQYLARRLNRSKGAISRAFSGEIPSLLARISRHLDWLQRRRAKRLAA
jgi:hypothetical protein